MIKKIMSVWIKIAKYIVIGFLAFVGLRLEWMMWSNNPGISLFVHFIGIPFTYWYFTTDDQGTTRN